MDNLSNPLRYLWMLQAYNCSSSLCTSTFNNWNQHVVETQESQSEHLSRIKCEACCKFFKTEHSLKSHRKTVHDRVFRVECAMCGHVFSNKYILKKHRSKQHPPKAEIS